MRLIRMIMVNFRKFSSIYILLKRFFREMLLNTCCYNITRRVKHGIRFMDHLQLKLKQEAQRTTEIAAEILQLS